MPVKTLSLQPPQASDLKVTIACTFTRILLLLNLRTSNSNVRAALANKVASPLNDMGKGGIGKDKSKEKYAAIISYKPHRVAKLLGFDQDVPGPLPKVGTDQLYAGNSHFYHGFLPNSQSVFWIPAFPPVSLCLKA